MESKNQRFARRHLLVILMTVLFTACASDEQGKGSIQAATKLLSKDELGDKIKDLLVKRPERPDSPDFDIEFKNLFGELDSLAVSMPDDFEFDFRLYGPPENHPTRQNIKAMKCLNTASQFKHFMESIHKILKELREEYLDDLNDSSEVDKPDSRDNDININDDKHDNNSTDDSKDTDTTTDSPDSNQDSRENVTVVLGNDDRGRVKRDTEIEGFDLDEILDKLEDDDIECLAGFISKGDEKFLCHRFSHRSSGIFTKIMAAGADCDDYLLDDDDDKDDHLDDSHQMAILKLYKEKDSKEVSDDDIRKLLRLAPDVLDDDFLDDLPEELFKQNLHRLGRLAAGSNINPRFRYALRRRLSDLDLSKLSAVELQKIGPGLLSLSLEQIKHLDGKLLLDSDLDDIFDDDSKEQDSKVKVDRDVDDDDDDDDDDTIKLAIGLQIKEAIRQSGLQKSQIGRTMRYLHHDLDFVRNIEPDDLLDALDDIRDISYDFDDARAVVYRMVQSSRFPQVSALSGHNLTHFGKLLRGMDVEFLSMLNKDSIEDALDDIKDIDFDDFQASQLVENMGYTVDLTNYENFDAPQVKRLGTLFRGIPVEGVAKIKQDALEEALDDLDDLDLSDVLKKTIVERVRHNDKISPKFLGLKSFAEVVSLDDLDDVDDNELMIYMNVSSNVRWSLPQAALLAERYKNAKAGKRLRRSDLAQMNLMALGLLPDDLDHMMVTQDDVFDVAEELKDIEDDLTSGQVDELVEKFSKISSLGSKQVVIDDLEAMQGAHVFAYLEPELFDKLEFTRAGKLALLSQLAKLSSHKMSREQVQFLAKKMLDMLEDTDSAESKNEKYDDRESRRLRSLGQMALGLTPSLISGFSGKAIIDNLDILRTLALSKAQAKAVLEKVEDAVENWRCDISVLARVGPLLQHHDNPFSDDCDDSFKEEQLSTLLTVAKSMEKRREKIQDRLDEGFGKENDDAIDDAGEKTLVEKIVSVATQRLNVRKRRAIPATAGALTCDVLIRLGNSVRLLDSKLLKAVPHEELKRCLPQLGSFGGWSQETLKVLAEKIKLVYAGVSTWSAKTVAAAGSIIAGLSPSEIQSLNGLTGVDVMHRISRHGKLTIDQLKAGFRRWMELNKKSDVSAITGSELSSLSEFVCGLEPAEISKIQDVSFKRSLNTIGKSVSCTEEQRQAYVKKAIAVYGSQINQWTPALIADMGHLLGALSGDHIKMLSSKQLALVSPKIIQTLPKHGVAAMTTTQLMSFSTNQANAITHAQYEALTAEQQKIVGSKSTIGFNKNGSKSGGENGSDSAFKGSSYGFLLLTTATLLASKLM